jgi:hypothetical protein
MAESGERLGFALEPLLQLRVRGDVFGAPIADWISYGPRRAAGSMGICAALYGKRWTARSIEPTMVKPDDGSTRASFGATVRPSVSENTDSQSFARARAMRGAPVDLCSTLRPSS